ncbi:type IV pili methyl-accepting chemotaxis transducer N-terminal domain-containing protein [Halomonas getboli]|uniref:type IV pili methyl-accepting chemotaxis transducer N-terminal domain-containing protein n=1 Tax=Halomonas getboli TaxID=2935862 RepID=UPI001FFE7F00|nr:type IV pili methyl-accepting chemotaxis transducer N-terminal domain-containing protein [Halomonas getboli]MCK2185154.1 type IV pili methyl-accepting chemotaxis transducer N-terminal domain-containing protein [Halomonas getboli]
MAGIVLLALTSMLGSIIIADTASGDAAAINRAGALRMQAYRLLATRLGDDDTAGQRTDRLAELDRSLASPLITERLPDDPRHALNRQYRTIVEQWREALRPMLRGASASPPAAIAARVDDFVARIDRLVGLLQREAEARLQRLRLLQGIILFLTLGLVFLAMYRLATEVIPPLRDLLDVVDRSRRGDFSGHTRYAADNELGLLSRTINQMNDSLSRIYGQLEARVEAKTAELERSNETLRLLYQAARRLNGAPPGDASYREVLDALAAVTGLGPITLCLARADAERAYLRLSTHGDDCPDFCRAPACKPCLDGGQHDAAPWVYRVSVSEAGRDYGVLLLQYPPSTPPQRWQRDLVETIAGLIATSISLSQGYAEQRRLALMDERAVIARELHDSLAQSLSYLKIQVARLQARARQTGADADTEAIVDELRGGLNAAYRQLRELLGTFRLKMTEAGLEAALEETVREFVHRGELAIRLDDRLDHCPLSPDEEVHVLQIVREALSNVVHHARASHCEVGLTADDAGRVTVRIRDDGIGLGGRSGQPDHYGTIIMRERAAGLGGQLELLEPAGGGTEIRLRFTPRLHRETTTTPRPGGTP